MFDKLSMRARQVIFGTRLKAGARGGDALSVGDLVLAIILEDQNSTSAFFPEPLGFPVEETTPLPMMNRLEPHRSFFSAEKAAELLAAVEAFLPRSAPTPTNTDMPITDDLGRVFKRAEQLQVDLRHSEIEPLHLLAAVLEQDSNETAALIEKAGVTKESVIAALKN